MRVDAGAQDLRITFFEICVLLAELRDLDSRPRIQPFKDRHQASAVAVARIDIHADGTIEVELSKPTQNPRLNALLLETLHKWRFFPAMQDGHPVESHQDVRAHFNVS